MIFTKCIINLDILQEFKSLPAICFTIHLLLLHHITHFLRTLWLRKKWKFSSVLNSLSVLLEGRTAGNIVACAGGNFISAFYDYYKQRKVKKNRFHFPCNKFVWIAVNECLTVKRESFFFFWNSNRNKNTQGNLTTAGVYFSVKNNIVLGSYLTRQLPKAFFSMCRQL